MINVVLDTSIYRANPKRDNMHFKALEKLSKENILRVHIPYVVLREFQTQQRDLYLKDLTKAQLGLSGLTKKNIGNPELLKRIDETRVEIEVEAELILAEAEHQIVIWADDIGACIHHLCLDQAHNALEAYFQGKPPLKAAKTRQDIPDSFVVQSIIKLSSELDGMDVVSGDSNILDAFSDYDSIATYSSLSEFIDTDIIQAELREMDLIDNIGLIVDAIEEFEDTHKEFLSFISGNIGDSIIGEKIYDTSIPDDNHEATICSYGDAEEIELDFSNIKYYGSGKFGIPFKLFVITQAYYYIYKSDYYCMEPDIRYTPTISDYSERYFEAEDEFELCVHGLVSITLDTNKIDPKNISKSILHDSFFIDEIANIELQ